MPAHDKCTFQVLHSFYDFQSVLRKSYNTFSCSSYKHGRILIKGDCFNSCVSRQHVQLSWQLQLVRLEECRSIWKVFACLNYQKY